MIAIAPLKSTHHLLAIMDDWRRNYHTRPTGEIIFQNKALLTNVVFTNLSFHQIQKHARGFELIPDVIEDPDEVWMTWADPKEQRVVLRNYIKFGPVSYIVQTRDGVVADAFVVTNTSADKYRKGCPWIKN